MGSQRVIIFVPTVGLEPTRAQCPKDFPATLCYHSIMLRNIDFLLGHAFNARRRFALLYSNVNIICSLEHVTTILEILQEYYKQLITALLLLP